MTLLRIIILLGISCAAMATALDEPISRFPP